VTEDEWRVVDAIRSGLGVVDAARALNIDEQTCRRRLSAAGEELRMASSLPPAAVGHDTPGPRLQIPHLSPCPYCENFAGRFSARSGAPAVVFEDAVVYVFLAPAGMGGMPGHTLVTTKRHVETIFDLTDDEASVLGTTVARAARMLRAALDPAGVLVQQNNGVAAFQTVPHVHFHVIPKVAGPFPPIEPPELIPPDERATLASELRRHW